MSVEVITKAEMDAALKQIFEQLNAIKGGQLEILGTLQKMKGFNASVVPDYIPALEFMKAVGIKRWKFDQLIAANLIKTVKKKRKIYVLVKEVDRYFMDPNIQ